MRYFFLAFILSVTVVVSVFGFRGHRFTDPPAEIFNDMDQQAKVKYQAESAFFADGLGAREPVNGTLPVGYEIPEKPLVGEGSRAAIEFSLPGDYYHTGRFGEYYGDGMPEGLTVDPALLKRGQERFAIYCAICHGESGNGQGPLKQFMPVLIANLHDPQFSDKTNPQFRPDGEIFEVISKGRGQMGSYGANITVHDRWAIIAYLRALQESARKAAPPVPAAAETPAAPATTPEATPAAAN
jgi:mono/diheme cytochrome c family protein